MNTCTDLCTPLVKVWDQIRCGWDTHMGIPTFRHNLAMGMQEIWGVRWTNIHVVMHINLLAKGWDQKRCGWSMQTGHTGVYVCMQLCKENGAGVRQTWGVKWKCIHVLMHVHLLAKGWDQKRCGLDMHIGNTGAEMYPTKMMGMTTGKKPRKITC